MFPSRGQTFPVESAPTEVPSLPFCAVMRDVAYVVELAKSYDRAEITRDVLQDQIHAVPLSVVQYGVIAFADEFGDEAAAAFVVAAELPIIWERAFTRAELDSDEETSWLPEGCWSIDRGDERVRDFPPE